MSLICISLIEKDLTDLAASAEMCKAMGADVIELRLDHLSEPLTNTTIKDIAGAIGKTGLPSIFTLRPLWEGGQFKGSEGDRLALIARGCEYGFEYIDIEFKTEESSRDRIIHTARQKEVKTIVSFHDHNSTPSYMEIFDQIKKCAETGCDIAKVVYQNNTIEDAFNVLKAGYAAKEKNLNFAVMGLGQAGYMTRIYAPVMGCNMVYTALEQSKDTPEGQMELGMLIGLWEFLGIKK